MWDHNHCCIKATRARVEKCLVDWRHCLGGSFFFLDCEFYRIDSLLFCRIAWTVLWKISWWHLRTSFNCGSEVFENFMAKLHRTYLRCLLNLILWLLKGFARDGVRCQCLPSVYRLIFWLVNYLRPLLLHWAFEELIVYATITCALINRPFVHHLLDHLIELELFKLWVNACTR